MNQQPTTRQLPSVLKQRINRMAHTAALRHESVVRDRLLAEMQRVAAHGADLAALEAHLTVLEGQP